MQICAIKLSETVETVDYTNKKCFFLQNKCVNIYDMKYINKYIYFGAKT